MVSLDPGEDFRLPRLISVLRSSVLLCAALALGPRLAVAQSNSDTSLVEIGSGGATTQALVAWAAGNKETPAILLLHDWWGLSPHARRTARTLARQGYVVMVPDLYHGERPKNAVAARARAASMDMDRAMSDIQGAVQWLRAQKRTKAAHIAVIGFNTGGQLAERFAMQSSEIAAVVMFSTEAIVDPERLKALRAPLLAHFASEDEYVDKAIADRLRSGLEKAGKQGRVFVYGGAHHGFTDEGRDQYHPDAAKLAWARTLAFLQSSVKAQE